MSFDYHKNKNAHSSDSFWTSYSDLFLGLSTIFLLLYVTASLRTGTDAIRAQIDSQKLTMENEELKNQLKMYESVKQNYLNKSAPRDELREYRELMDKLSLLKDEAKTDSERLARESLENERKSVALNKYQQMIRNIINANKVAKTKIIARNDLIDEQDTTIVQQKDNISSLEQDIAGKKQMIARNEQKIAQTESALAANQQRLLSAFKSHQMTKKAYEAKQRKLQADAAAAISKVQADSEAHVQDLKDAFAAEKSRELEAFNAQMAKSQADAAEKARMAAEFQAAAAAKERNMNARIAGLAGKLNETEGRLNETQGRLGAAEGNLARTAGALAKAQGDLARTSSDLAKAKEEIDARRAIAREIKKGFAGAGIKADIDMQTGEVVLDFGNHYFESDSANLKAEMKNIIEKAMPVYSKSLFGNQKIAPKISAVEIIGFASPTYKGRFVDPNSNKSNDRAALKYNMDLSYRRANSIFNYLVEEKGPEFEYKKGLMSLMKVSGRSFLEVMKVSGRTPANASDFCKLNDCKRAQKVIVRFSMDAK